MELVKRLVLAWDPDFTKLTLEEAENGEYIDSENIDWDDIEEVEPDESTCKY